MQGQKIKRLVGVVALVIVLLGVFAAGAITGYAARPAFAADQPTEFTVFWEAWKIVTEHFVDRDKIDATRMTYGAIQGMLDSLGDQNHTVFLPPEVAKAEASSMQGSFEGIGAHVDMVNDQFKIIAPIHGSPAEAAGILAGDIIVKVDGVDVTGLPEWEVISKVRGPAGSTVVLTVLHPNEKKTVDIPIVRAKIDIESVLWARVPETELAYIQITQFANDTNAELTEALQAIWAEAKHRPLKGIILDLRNNPGGLLHEAIRVGSHFLPEGKVILNQRDAEGRVQAFKSVDEGLARDLPMIVLVNEGSASAAEILAGALQAHQRATLVGITTVGTGTVLIPFTLSDGSLIRLGVTNWLTPNMHLVKGQGIEPDVMLQQEPTVEKITVEQLREASDLYELSKSDQQFNTALMLLRLQIRNTSS
jgi:carboxyl-terminal processing protease